MANTVSLPAQATRNTPGSETVTATSLRSQGWRWVVGDGGRRAVRTSGGCKPMLVPTILVKAQPILAPPGACHDSARLGADRQHAVQGRAGPVGDNFKLELHARLDAQSVAVLFLRLANPAIDDCWDRDFLELAGGRVRLQDFRPTADENTRGW